MIETKNLCFAYIKQPLCLKDVNFSVRDGEKVAILGGEGMGKTALLRVLSGQEEQFFGEIRYDGTSLLDIPKNKRDFSYLPSDPILFENKSIKQNLDYVFSVFQKPALDIDALEKILKDFKINASLDAKVKILSLCQKRCLAIARAFLKNAKYVFVDDQTTGLTDEEIDTIKNAISILCECKNSSKTFIFAFENKKSMVTDVGKVFYLSFSKLTCFESFSDLEVVDLFSTNYLDLKTKDLMLKKEDSLFLVEFEMEKVKKKEHIKVLNKIKVGAELASILEKSAALNFNEYFKVVLAFPSQFEWGMSDEVINKKLTTNEFYLFDSATGDKLV